MSGRGSGAASSRSVSPTRRIISWPAKRIIRSAWSTRTRTTARWVSVPPAWAEGSTRDLLKTGMTLTAAVETFGQRARMEWVNQKGTPVLSLFYQTEDRFSLFRLFGNDLVTLEDGRTYTPLAFVTELLVGWGKKFYDQTRFPQQ